MKFVCTLMLAMGICVVALQNATAEDGKEVTLKGQLVCCKCEAEGNSEVRECHCVKEGQDVVYYFKDMGAKESYHKACCQAPADASVKGVVSEKDGKKIITPAKDGVKLEK